MNKKKFTYKKSGVNINAADSFINFISNISSKKKGKKKYSNIGGFGSITNIPYGIDQPKIVACTDGVGTKVEIANTLNKYDTIGIDLVAMSVNDLVVQGAKPLIFLDYISINKINPRKLKSIVKGIIAGCKISNCELVGGETAEMPGTYSKGKFDIAGFAVGIVDKNKILDKSKIKANDLIVQGARPLLFLDYISTNKINLKKLKSIIKGILKGCRLSGCELVGGETAEMPGTYEKNKFDIAGFAVGVVNKKKILRKNQINNNDLILAIPSSGLHSNGFSLVRYLINEKKINIKKNKYLSSELLKPTKIYVNEVLKLINKNLINGCANITGGGLSDNIKRVIPDKLVADIDLNKIKTLSIFKWLRKQGISEKEMLKTFNCGVGFCLIIKNKNLKKVSKFFSRNFKPYVIGKISKGNNKVKLNGSINWS